MDINVSLGVDRSASNDSRLWRTLRKYKAIFDVDKLPYAGAQSNPVAALIFCGTSHETKHTIVNGEFTVRNGVLLGFDEEIIKNKANEISKRMLEKA